MKHLITEEHMLRLKKAGSKICEIDEDTLITPSAQDVARHNDIKFIKCDKDRLKKVEPKNQECRKKANREEIIAAVIKVLEDRGII